MSEDIKNNLHRGQCMTGENDYCIFHGANAGELVGNKVICTFGIEKSKNPDYPDDKNNIKGFKPLEKMSPKQADDTPAWVTEGTSEAKAPAKPSL